MPAVELSTETAALLRDWKRDQTELRRRFDTNKDGDIDPAEWEIARTVARKDLESSPPNTSSPPTVDTLRDPRDPARPYVLSAFTEDRLVARNQGYASLLTGVSAVIAFILGWCMWVRAVG